MIFPAATALYAAMLALIYVGLSSWIIAGRVTKDTLFGDGSDEAMTRRIRAHANFIEYVPLNLILIGLLEAGGASEWLAEALLIALVVARILHPVGMMAPKNSVQQFACRGGGIIVTLLVMLVASVTLLVRLS